MTKSHTASCGFFVLRLSQFCVDSGDGYPVGRENPKLVCLEPVVRTASSARMAPWKIRITILVVIVLEAKFDVTLTCVIKSFPFMLS